MDENQIKKVVESHLAKEIIKEKEKLTEHTESIIQKENRKLSSYITSVIKEQKGILYGDVKYKLDTEVSQLFENTLFMERAEAKVIKMVTSEVRVAVKNAQLHKLVGDLVKQYVEDNLT